MAKNMNGLIDRFLTSRQIRRWGRAAGRAARLDLADLRAARTQARALRRQIDRFLFIAEGRLTLPLIGSNAFPKPLHCDWSYRPEAWRGPIQPLGRAAAETRSTYGEEVTLFHDCRYSELTVRQIRNTKPEDLAPFGLRMDVFNFEGSFLSLAIDLPAAAVKGLTRRHIIRMNTVVETEKPLEVFVRLNIRHGPNTEQIVRELPLAEKDVWVEFDLAYTKMNEKRVEKMWVDLIFERPDMNQVMLRDVSFSRRPRAEM